MAEVQGESVSPAAILYKKVLVLQQEAAYINHQLNLKEAKECHILVKKLRDKIGECIDSEELEQIWAEMNAKLKGSSYIL